MCKKQDLPPALLKIIRNETSDVDFNKKNVGPKSEECEGAVQVHQKLWNQEVRVSSAPERFCSSVGMES